MSKQVFAILVAKDKSALLAVANSRHWTIIQGTGFAFEKLVSDDDHAVSFLDGMDAIETDTPGCLALAYRNE